MFALRTARASALFNRTTSLRPFTAAFSTTTTRPSGSDYGSGEANPQTSRSQTAKDHEHPGPPPPSTGGGKSGDKQASESKGGEKSGEKPQPKLHSASHPKEGEESEDVRKHNEDMKKRAEQSLDGQ